MKGGKFSRVEGNQLALLSPHVKGDKHPQHAPKIGETIASDKIDHGWGNVKDPKIQKELKEKIANETKGKTPKTLKATLPPDVAQKMTKGHGLSGTTTPGKKLLTTSGSPSGTAAPPGKHPGKPFNLPATGATATPAGKPGLAIRHPGQPLNLQTNPTTATPATSPTEKRPLKTYNPPTTGATPGAAPTPFEKHHKPSTGFQPQGGLGPQPTPTKPQHRATPPPPRHFATPLQYYKPTPPPYYYKPLQRPIGRPTPTPTPRKR
jgi:hypothetical protein